MDNIRAFPNSYRDTDDWPVVEDGMTLRDYFAAKAMQGLLTGFYRESTRENLSEVPSEAYCIADAMLAEREKGQ